jgi:hypothetical protein
MTKQKSFYQHNRRLSSYLALAELNDELWKSFKLKVDLSMCNSVDVNGIEVKCFEHCILKMNEVTGKQDLWSLQSLEKLIDDMKEGVDSTAQSIKDADNLIDLIVEFMGHIEDIFEVKLKCA